MATNLTAKQQYWSEQLEHAERNGQSLADYAKANNIPVQKLYQWRSSLKSKTTTRTIREEVRFTELVLQTRLSSALRLQHKEASFQFDVLPEADWLVQLVRQLHES